MSKYNVLNKKAVFTFLYFVFCILTSQIEANNLNEKIINASNGDTLLLSKNTTLENFENSFSSKENPLNINKSINIWGSGIYSQNKNEKYSNLGYVSISEGAMNVIIRSCYIEEINFNITTFCKGIKFSGCYIKNIKFLNKELKGKLSEIIFEGCYINGMVDFNSNAEILSNSIFRNNFFVGAHITNSGKNAKSLQFVNNNFIGNSILDNLESIIFTNNLFINADIKNISMSTFNNNLTFNCRGNKIIPFGNNSGNFNYCDANPMYKNILNLENPNFEIICNFIWKPNELSPLQNTGKDYKDIGITGGKINIFNEHGIYTGIYNFK